MERKQITLSERINIAETGMAADASALAGAIRRSAGLTMDEFFFDQNLYCDFLEEVQTLHLDNEIRTYQDVVMIIYSYLHSDDKKNQIAGEHLLEYIVINHIDMSCALYAIDDENYQKIVNDAVKERMGYGTPLSERIKNTPPGWVERFPVMYLSTQQLYQGAAEIAGDHYPNEFYEKMVRPCVQNVLEKKLWLTDILSYMILYGVSTDIFNEYEDEDGYYHIDGYEDFYGSDESDKDGPECGKCNESSSKTDSNNECKGSEKCKDSDSKTGCCKKSEMNRNENDQEDRLIWYMMILPYVLSQRKGE